MSEGVFLALDCESGGIGKDISLLSAHFSICDAKWNIIDELPILLKPDEVDETGSTLYRVTASALAINNIDLIAHDKVALTKSAAGGQLREFLWKYKPAKGWLMPMGKNVQGDVDWVNQHILGNKEWRKIVSYRVYDITTMITMAKRSGKLAADAPEGLCELAKFLGFEFAAHTADGDVHAGIFVTKYLENL